MANCLSKSMENMMVENIAAKVERRLRNRRGDVLTMLRDNFSRIDETTPLRCVLGRYSFDVVTRPYPANNAADVLRMFCRGYARAVVDDFRSFPLSQLEVLLNSGDGRRRTPADAVQIYALDYWEHALAEHQYSFGRLDS